MRYLTLRNVLLTVVASGLIAAGCIVSGTFVIIEDVDFDFTANSGVYWYPVDLTEDEDWQDHKDDIDFIDAVGMEFTIQNTSLVTCELNAWFMATSGMTTEPMTVPSGATKVINGLTVAAQSTKKVSYQESLGYITNLEAFKEIVKSGRFDYYGTSCGGTADSLFKVTNGKIIITVSASGT